MEIYVVKYLYEREAELVESLKEYWETKNEKRIGEWIEKYNSKIALVYGYWVMAKINDPKYRELLICKLTLDECKKEMVTELLKYESKAKIIIERIKTEDK